MNKRDLAQCAEKVFAWSMKQTGDRLAAEELAQQILLEALESMPRIRCDEAFYGWFWSLAKNVYKRWAYKVRRERFFNISLSLMDGIVDSEHDDLCDDADKESLINAVSSLSSQWRDITVMHYYDGLEIKEIAKRMGLPEGTVKWRLSEARRRLKEEIAEMPVDFRPTLAIRPLKLRVTMCGSGDYPRIAPWPPSYLWRGVAQNIAGAAYEEPATIEEISRRTGIPAYYVEEELNKLEHTLPKRLPERGFAPHFKRSDAGIPRHGLFSIRKDLGRVQEVCAGTPQGATEV